MALGVGEKVQEDLLEAPAVHQHSELRVVDLHRQRLALGGLGSLRRWLRAKPSPRTS
jgi:hypothetical protein